MKEKYKSRFKSLIRIDPKQRNYLAKNKDCRTMAGFLDKIINQYKRSKNIKQQ